MTVMIERYGSQTWYNTTTNQQLQDDSAWSTGWLYELPNSPCSLLNFSRLNSSAMCTLSAQWASGTASSLHRLVPLDQTHQFNERMQLSIANWMVGYSTWPMIPLRSVDWNTSTSTTYWEVGTSWPQTATGSDDSPNMVRGATTDKRTFRVNEQTVSSWCNAEPNTLPIIVSVKNLKC